MNKEYVLITGASSGIGQEIAVRLSAGYQVVLHGRNSDKLKEIRSLCDPGSNTLIWEVDLNSITDIEAELDTFIKANHITISHFVHCAGYMKMAPLKMSSIEVLSRTFNVNVFAAHVIIKALNNKKINESALANVVFISSNISNMGAKAMSIYGSSKSALDGLMRGLAVELAPKIRVNSVLPGAIRTEMTADIFDNSDVAGRMTATYPLGIGEAGDIAEMVDFLLSPKAKWITGQQFIVDGGRSINITG